MTKEIYIGGNVASSKNSNGFNTQTKTSYKSKTTYNYIKNTAKEYALLANTFRTMLKGKTPPYRIEFTFIRDKHKKFDYINAAQIVQDLMVKNKWLEDDNCDVMIPVFAPYQYKKDDGGVIIRVLESDGWEEDDFEIGDIPKLKASDLFY
jgi:hypothetical protein